MQIDNNAYSSYKPAPPIGKLVILPRNVIPQDFVPYDSKWKTLYLNKNGLGIRISNPKEYIKFLDKLSDKDFKQTFIESWPDNFTRKIQNVLKNNCSVYELAMLSQSGYKIMIKDHLVDENNKPLTGECNVENKKINIARTFNGEPIEAVRDIKFILNHEMGHLFNHYNNYYSQSPEFAKNLDFDMQELKTIPNNIPLLENFMDLRGGKESMDSDWGKSELFAHIYQSLKMKDDSEYSRILDDFPRLSRHLELYIEQTKQKFYTDSKIYN